MFIQRLKNIVLSHFYMGYWIWSSLPLFPTGRCDPKIAQNLPRTVHLTQDNGRTDTSPSLNPKLSSRGRQIADWRGSERRNVGMARATIKGPTKACFCYILYTYFGRSTWPFRPQIAFVAGGGGGLIAIQGRPWPSKYFAWEPAFPVFWRTVELSCRK